MNKPDRLISHDAHSEFTNHGTIEAVKARLRSGGDLPGVTLEEQLDLVDHLSKFELGQFLLVNRGLDAYWTHRLVTYEPGTLNQGAVSDLEFLIFEKLPAVLATRERFSIFQRELQAMLQQGSVCASVPCGWMGDLLLLDYANCADVTLLGVDLDRKALDGARALANDRGHNQRLRLHQADAWEMGLNATADVLTSNGINIYEADDERVITLYRKFFDALKPGGHLVTSFLTPPPTLSSESPWDMSASTPALLALQNVLFTRVIDVRWGTFRTHAQSSEQLTRAGFTDITFLDDRARMFPTVVARKPL